ncbi:MAG: prepilin-type cleavage/methylation domain-containing protein, partial [Gammaproteobacteria bacterium]|nr:prepilin-type cleavage/methylation domain-containing protein [Gammaproteobacteria bacterium]
MKLHRGYTLLSLLIAMAIGIFITGVAGKVYVDSKMAFLARSAVAATNENGRFAIDDLRRTLVMAGRGVSSG